MGINSTIPLSRALEIWQIVLLLLIITIVYFIMSKVNFPIKQLLASIAVLIVWNLTTNLTFTLDYWLLAIAQLIYDSNRIANSTLIK